MWAAKTVTPPIQVIPVACCLCVRHTFITRCSDHWNAMCVAAWKSRRQWNRSVCIRIGCISFNDRLGPWPWHYNLLSPRCYQLLSSWLTTWTVAFWRKGVVLKDIWFWFLFDEDLSETYHYLANLFCWFVHAFYCSLLWEVAWRSKQCWSSSFSFRVNPALGDSRKQPDRHQSRFSSHSHRQTFWPTYANILEGQKLQHWVTLFKPLCVEK